MSNNQRDQYRQNLLKLRDRLSTEIRNTVERVRDKNAAPDELSNLPTHLADRDSEGLQSEIAVEENREQMLDAIDESLKRIERGTYGRCADCGTAIPAERLELLPFASRCVECEARRERQ